MRLVASVIPCDGLFPPHTRPLVGKLGHRGAFEGRLFAPSESAETVHEEPIVVCHAVYNDSCATRADSIGSECWAAYRVRGLPYCTCIPEEGN